MERDYHVRPNLKGWDVIQENGLETFRFKDQQEAIKAARTMSQREKKNLFIYGNDGKIIRKESWT
ncbi:MULTISPECIES: DUF2188 domain-containing protein [Legionella]|uniref:DUF2188 domain-containing protein n=1 Tax=Legionella drozanskii LLAP-1 TaxID=1212489 RepID=A0A0W0SWT9_9GAMM|nr:MULTISPECIES: DUF2188 domain-containing protein [Legionella]KTC87823.1 hypothetical protein Ldro_1442 [Legionella drozanskii LLAP-1]PJE18238.1 MAG: DUF2188 domain-containing protein [Legionella sp.]